MLTLHFKTCVEMHIRDKKNPHYILQDVMEINLHQNERQQQQQKKKKMKEKKRQALFCSLNEKSIKKITNFFFCCYHHNLHKIWQIKHPNKKKKPKTNASWVRTICVCMRVLVVPPMRGVFEALKCLCNYKTTAQQFSFHYLISLKYVNCKAFVMPYNQALCELFILVSTSLVSFVLFFYVSLNTWTIPHFVFN